MSFETPKFLSTRRLIAAGLLAPLTVAATACSDFNPKVTAPFKAINCNAVSYDPNIISALPYGTDLTHAEAISTGVSKALCEEANSVALSMVTGYKEHAGNGYGGTIENGQFDIISGDLQLTDAYFGLINGRPNLADLQSVQASEIDQKSQNKWNEAIISYDSANHSFSISTDVQYSDPNWPNLPIEPLTMNLSQFEQYSQQVNNFLPWFDGTAMGNQVSY